MKKVEYPFTVRPLPKSEGGGYLVEFPDLPGCMADGATPEEAIEEASDALESWIKTAREFGDEIPTPSAAANYSGRWLVRAPKSVHRRLAERARAEGVSLNALTIALLSESLGQRKRPRREPQTRGRQRSR
jgi:antitoxin HicB